MTKPSSIAGELENVLRDITGVPGITLGSGPSPLAGGFDTDTYAFSLDGAPQSLSGDLVLRHYRRADEANRVLLESALQNTAAEAGHAVPAVPIDSAGALIAGRPFIVMRRMPGATLLDVLSQDPMGALEPAGRLMGRTQSRLHGLDPAPVMRSLQQVGLDPAAYTPFRLLGDIFRLAETVGDASIAAIGRWLEDNRPDPPSRLSICHGDFHPANILVDDLRLTGVIDWGNYLFGHPEFDIAVTRMVVTIGPLEDSPVPVDELKRMLDRFVAVYLQAYREDRGIDESLVDYYTALRAARAVAKVVGARFGRDVRGVAHDGYAWERPVIYEHVRALVHARTGVDAGPLNP